jgi:hypothetical protein
VSVNWNLVLWLVKSWNQFWGVRVSSGKTILVLNNIRLNRSAQRESLTARSTRRWKYMCVWWEVGLKDWNVLGKWRSGMLRCVCVFVSLCVNVSVFCMFSCVVLELCGVMIGGVRDENMQNTDTFKHKETKTHTHTSTYHSSTFLAHSSLLVQPPTTHTCISTVGCFAPSNSRVAHSDLI